MAMRKREHMNNMLEVVLQRFVKISELLRDGIQSKVCCVH